MAILEVVLYPDDPLTQVARPFDRIGPNVVKLAEDMFDTMYTYDGVGLAGPQAGVSRRIFVCHPPELDPMCLVNPEILASEGSAEGEEGCLSLPEVFASVPRATFIKVRAKDPYGNPLEFEARDFTARVIQHEVDHLEGRVFPDRLDILTRQAKMQEWAEVRNRLRPSPAGVNG